MAIVTTGKSGTFRPSELIRRLAGELYSTSTTEIIVTTYSSPSYQGIYTGNFAVDEAGIVSGTVTSFRFIYKSDAYTFVRMENLSYDASRLMKLVANGKGETLLAELLAGDDIIDVQQFQSYYGKLDVFGFSGDDIITGSTSNDTINGGGGNDQIHAGSGDDTIKGLFGADTLFGEFGNDTLSGGKASDILYGGYGNDTLFGGQSSDLLYGGDGEDQLYGNGGKDLLFGQQGSDTIAGGGGSDVLRGQGGRDWLSGGAGDDRLAGDGGRDILTGGRGADTFIFQSAKKAEGDTITDFSVKQGDSINLKKIDAHNGSKGNQAFEFIDDVEFSGTAGELRIWQGRNKTFVEGDVDGDRNADFKVILEGYVDLSAGDFLL